MSSDEERARSRARGCPRGRVLGAESRANVGENRLRARAVATRVSLFQTARVTAERSMFPFAALCGAFACSRDRAFRGTNSRASRRIIIKSPYALYVHHQNGLLIAFVPLTRLLVLSRAAPCGASLVRGLRRAAVGAKALASRARSPRSRARTEPLVPHPLRTTVHVPCALSRARRQGQTGRARNPSAGPARAHVRQSQRRKTEDPLPAPPREALARGFARARLRASRAPWSARDQSTVAARQPQRS